MIFDDLFYPDNPKRRQEVANLRGEILTVFRQYASAWNENANLLNDAFRQAAKPGTPFYDMTLPMLQKNIDKDPIGECINEINETMKDADVKLKNCWTTLV